MKFESTFSTLIFKTKLIKLPCKSYFKLISLLPYIENLIPLDNLSHITSLGRDGLDKSLLNPSTWLRIVDVTSYKNIAHPDKESRAGRRVPENHLYSNRIVVPSSKHSIEICWRSWLHKQVTKSNVIEMRLWPSILVWSPRKISIKKWPSIWYNKFFWNSQI